MKIQNRNSTESKGLKKTNKNKGAEGRANKENKQAESTGNMSGTSYKLLKKIKGTL